MEEDETIDFERVVELISKFETLKKTGEIRKYNEEMTKKDFILPLFEALGWNVYNRGKKNDTVSAEELISQKRVDYGFRINGIAKFFLEAKSLKEENIQFNQKYISQAIEYSWMKTCSWAILCNFETIAVYNADWKGNNFSTNQFFVLHISDFLKDDMFTKLSKSSFENDEIDNIASKFGKKQVKNPINKQLLQDLVHFREIISKNIVLSNKEMNLSQEDVDEVVQRILDRLMFIRNAEDKTFEENKLQSKVRQWSAKGKGALLKEIKRIYKEYDEVYNSKLFAHHLCDEVDLDNEILQEVIEGLNEATDHSYRYDFSLIEADVLGSIYEQYLGNILKTTPKKAKLSESKTHRKEEGIFYTPSHIVDYIIKNTVGEYLKTHTPEEVSKVRILDPACGSGSFLLRAYQELEDYWKKQEGKNSLVVGQAKFDFDNTGQYYTKKLEILKNNIFGVDKDPKAVEIAQLNLLLKVSEKKQRLPLLQNNIKVGDSLVAESKVSSKAFVWEKEFKEIMESGGFDLIIGNPPYERTLYLEEEKEYYNENYKSAFGSYDIYVLFMELATNLLRQNGIFGFIVSNKFMVSDYGKKIRELITSEGKIKRVIDLADAKRVFPDALISPAIIFLLKTSNISDYSVERFVADNKSVIIDDQKLEEIPFANFINSDGTFNVRYDKTNNSIENKLKKMLTLDEIADVRTGIMGFEYWSIAPFMHDGKSKKDDIRIATNSYVEQYSFLWSKPVKVFKKQFNEPYASLSELPINENTKSLFKTRPKIIVRGVAKRLTAAIDNEGIGILVAVHSVIPKEGFSQKLVTAYLNSNFMNWFHKQRFYLGRIPEGSLKYPISFLKQIPIPQQIPDDLMTKITDGVDELERIKKQLKNTNSSTDLGQELLKNISEKEKEIDSFVFQAYGLTKNEIEIVKSSN